MICKPLQPVLDCAEVRSTDRFPNLRAKLEPQALIPAVGFEQAPRACIWKSPENQSGTFARAPKALDNGLAEQ